MKNLILLLPLLFFELILNAQLQPPENPTHICGYDDIMYSSHLPKELTTHFNGAAYRKYINQSSGPKMNNEVLVMPVVVHIIHDHSPLGSVANPTNAEVEAVILDANQRFRHQSGLTFSNPFSGIDTEIELCLAKEVPNGNYTSGVIRYVDEFIPSGQSYQTIWMDLRDNYAWDTDKYLNIFVINNMQDALGVYYGFATLYRASWFRGRALNHEVGHNFGLLHTFQTNMANTCPTNNDCLTDGDRVCDTPPKGVSGSAAPCDMPDNNCDTDENDTSCNNPYRPTTVLCSPNNTPGLGDQPDILENYMDYTENCWQAYTIGQKDLMRFSIQNVTFLSNVLANNVVCAPQALPANDAGISTLVVDQADKCTADATVSGTLTNYGTSALTTVMIKVELNDVPVYSEQWTGNIAPGQSAPFTLANAIILNIGLEDMTVKTDLPNGGQDGDIYNDANYTNVEYYGGTSCIELETCTTFNPNTASGPGNSTIVEVSPASFPELGAGVMDVFICATTEGDASFSGEVFNLIDEDEVTVGTTNFGSDCSGPTPRFCFSITRTRYNNWKADGTISFTFDPVSTQINPSLCLTNQACITLIVPDGDGATPLCEDTLVVSASPANGLYQAGMHLNTSGMVIVSDTTTFTAGQSILLNQGFHAYAGSYFNARIDTCVDQMTNIQPGIQPLIEDNNIVRVIPNEQLKVFPNPFKLQTYIHFSIAETTRVDLSLFDANGRQVLIPYNAQEFPKGTHQLELSRKDLAPGIYYLQLKTRNNLITRKLVVSK